MYDTLPILSRSIIYILALASGLVRCARNQSNGNDPRQKTEFVAIVPWMTLPNVVEAPIDPAQSRWVTTGRDLTIAATASSIQVCSTICGYVVNRPRRLISLPYERILN